jgi:tetratricopeptide (TPR) repeat protein
MDQADRRYLEGEEGVLAGLALFDQERAHREAVRVWLWAQPADPMIDTLLWDEANATAFIEELRDPVRTVRLARWEHLVGVARRRGDRGGEGRALGNLGNAYQTLGEARRAIGSYEQHLAITREVGDRRGEGWALGNLGNAYWSLGEARRASGYYEQHLAIAREVGDRHGEGAALSNLGNAYEALGEARTAIGYHEQHLAIAREVGDRRGEGWALDHLGAVHCLLGNFAEALTCCEASLVLTLNVGDRRLEGIVLRHLATAQAALGHWAEAEVNYAASLTIHKEMQHARQLARTRWSYGQFLVRQGKRERGIALLAESVAYEQRIGHAQAEEHAALVEHLRAGGELPA